MEATENMERNLPQAVPMRLGLLLNLSRSCNDTLKHQDDVCEFGKKVFDSAIAELHAALEGITLYVRRLRGRDRLRQS